jgi:hypothetical protein
MAPGVVALMIGFALAGFGINATQVGAYTVGAHVYATDALDGRRCAAGLGESGGILSAFAGGALLTWFGGPGVLHALRLSWCWRSRNTARAQARSAELTPSFGFGDTVLSVSIARSSWEARMPRR